MEFTFALYEPRKRRPRVPEEPKVEITPSGRLVFNQKAAEMLDNIPYCQLGYDAARHAVGVLPLREKNINAFPVRYTRKGAYIAAKKFFVSLNIRPEQPVACRPVVAGKFIGLSL